MDIALDSQGDIAVVGGDLVLTDSISQEILIKLRWAKGEWKYNEDLGVDYFGVVLVKDPNLNEISRIIREAILTVDGVDSIEDCTVSIDTEHRKLTAKIIVICNQERLEKEVTIDV